MLQFLTQVSPLVKCSMGGRHISDVLEGPIAFAVKLTVYIRRHAVRGHCQENWSCSGVAAVTDVICLEAL